MRFYDDLNFKKTKKICMENVAGEQSLKQTRPFSMFTRICFQIRSTNEKVRCKRVISFIPHIILFSYFFDKQCIFISFRSLLGESDNLFVSTWSQMEMITEVDVAWFSYVGKIPDDRGFYLLPTIPDIADVSDIRKWSVPDFTDYL